MGDPKIDQSKPNQPLVPLITTARQRLVAQGIRAPFGSVGWAVNDDDAVPFDQAAFLLAQSPLWRKDYGVGSVVLVDQTNNNISLGSNSLAIGSKCETNADLSLVSGSSSRTGFPARSFTCVAGGTTLTVAGLDVTLEYRIGVIGMLNNTINIGYFDADGVRQLAERIVLSITLVGPDTEIVLDSAIDDITTSGICADPWFGTGGAAIGISCIATGYGAQALGGNATASGFMSTAQGTFVTAEKNFSKATGYSSKATDYAEQAHSSGLFSQQGDNQTRVLKFFCQCEDGSTMDMTLDGTSLTFPGSEVMTLPDESISTWQIRLAALEYAPLSPNYGDCWTAIYTVGIKKIGGVMSLVGAGIATVLDEKDGAAGWTFSLNIAGSDPIPKFTAENFVKASCEITLLQITQL